MFKSIFKYLLIVFMFCGYIASNPAFSDDEKPTHLFTEDEATQLMRELTTDIARLQGELRHAHLAAHLTTQATLSAEQIAVYDRLRGYGEQPSNQ